MRAFVAVEISEEAREEVARLQGKLRSTRADVKWVEPESLHLTLKFLGEIDEARVPELAGALSSGIRMPRFAFTLEGTGAFPKPEHPQILWVGIHEGKELLAKLALEVEAACSRCGFPPEERPFSPHLTIGRVRSSKGLSHLVKLLEGLEFPASAPCSAEKVVLFQSVLSPRGPAYIPRAQIPLAAEG